MKGNAMTNEQIQEYVSILERIINDAPEFNEKNTVVSIIALMKHCSKG
jgi:hypothetical protein